MSTPLRIGVVIPSGGRGTRFGGEQPKQYVLVEGVPILIRSLRTALAVGGVTQVVVAMQTEEFPTVREMLETHHCTDARIVLVEGGSERMYSVARALEHPSLNEVDVVLIHDAVRPFATVDLFERIAQAAHQYGAVIPTLAVPDTLKRVDTSECVVETVDRSQIRRAQTPQGFHTSLIRTVYANAIATNLVGTDCASLCEGAGLTVHIVNGEEQNIKITTPFDLSLGIFLLNRDSSTST